jgi:predicted DsbA family dithiol-disulfide isomerase
MQRYALDFQWRGFELHPEIPLGGMDVRRMFPEAQVQAMFARLRQVAEGMGVPFDPPMHAPNTKRALAISEHARAEGKLDAWREHTMDAYWQHGRNIEDEAVLRELASASGLDADTAMAFLDQPQVPQLLMDQRLEAQRWGVNSIPTWFVLPSGWSPEEPWPEDHPDKPVRVVGCQPMEVVERAAKMAGARPL